MTLDKKLEAMDLREFLIWRKKNPKEYKQYLGDLKGYYTDLIKMLDEINFERERDLYDPKGK